MNHLKSDHDYLPIYVIFCKSEVKYINVADMIKMVQQARVVIITDDAFEDEEVIYPIIRLNEAGFVVDVATKEKKMIRGRLNFPLELMIKYYATHVDALELKEKNYDMVLVPGGFEAPDRVRQIPEVLEFIQAMNKKGKIVGAFCHGPWVLVSAGILKGKRATSYVGIKDDIKNAGAHYIDTPVVIDGNIITSRHPRELGEFMKTILREFKKTRKVL